MYTEDRGKICSGTPIQPRNVGANAMPIREIAPPHKKAEGNAVCTKLRIVSSFFAPTARATDTPVPVENPTKKFTIKWVSDESIKSWGYGEDVKTPEEFADRYVGLTDVIVNNYKMFGFCYTQLYDIEQEQNGLYTYDREKKFDEEIYDRIRAINTKIAEIEK